LIPDESGSSILLTIDYFLVSSSGFCASGGLAMTGSSVWFSPFHSGAEKLGYFLAGLCEDVIIVGLDFKGFNNGSFEC